MMAPHRRLGASSGGEVESVTVMTEFLVAIGVAQVARSCRAFHRCGFFLSMKRMRTVLPIH